GPDQDWWRSFTIPRGNDVLFMRVGWHVRRRRWQPVTSDESRNYVSVSDRSGLVRYPQILCKNMQSKTQPAGVPGGGLVYDPFHKVLLVQSGKKATQFAGGDDSIT